MLTTDMLTTTKLTDNNYDFNIDEHNDCNDDQFYDCDNYPCSKQANNSNEQINLNTDNNDDYNNSFNNNPNSPSAASSNKQQRQKIKQNINSRVKFSNSVLFLTSCSNGDIEECDRLLKNNLVDVDVTTCDGLTGLHEAAISGNLEMVEYLLKMGANINCQDNEGWTPLHAAASLNEIKIVQLLLEFGALPTIITCENLLAYDLARKDDVKELIAKYLKNYDLDELRDQEKNAIQNDLNRWIKTGKYEERSQPINNATVLHVIAAKGYTNLMKQILNSKVLRKQINLEAKDNEGFTPLLAACYWSQNEIVELLIEHGADISAQALNGYSISSSQLQKYQQYKSQQPQPLLKPVDVSLSSSPTAVYHSTNSSASSSNNVPTAIKQSTAADTFNETKLIDEGETVNTQFISSPSPSRAQRSTAAIGNLHKSQSLDISKATNNEASSSFSTTNVISTTRSLDELLKLTESMSERDLRKTYKNLLVEHEKLKKHLNEFENDWIRRERQMQRKISELEEEIKLMDQCKREIQHLKDENSSLIRVVSKLSKQH